MRFSTVLVAVVLIAVPGLASAQLGGVGIPHAVPSMGLPSGIGGIPAGGGLPAAGLPAGGLPTGGSPAGGLPNGGLPNGGLPAGGLPERGLPSVSLPGGVQGGQLQLPNGGVTVPPAVDKLIDGVTNTAGSVTNAAQRATDAAGRPYRPERLETDLAGDRVVKSEVIALSPSNATLAVARRLNFQIVRQVTLAGLNLRVAVLRAPQNLSANDALSQLRTADPSGVYDYNHIYDPSGAATASKSNRGFLFWGKKEQSPASGITLGIVDSGIELSHPVLNGANIVMRNFAGPEKSPPAAHGTAIASILLGNGNGVSGTLKGAKLYAADIYGGRAEGGSADVLAQGLAWVADKGATVINVSLTGPANRTLEAVIAALIARGHVIVAAAGNDGPAHPVGFPAAYPGVIAVSSVDEAMHIQIDANRGPEISYCARGVDVPVAALNRNYARETGTSFAAPIVATRFAFLMPKPDADALRRAEKRLQSETLDLGAPGRDPVFGYGFLGAPAPLTSVSLTGK